MDIINYSMDSDNPEVPYNQTDLPEKEIEVLVSVTLSKTVKVKVNDYQIDEGEDDGEIYSGIDYSKCNLREAVEDQIVLPQEASLYVKANTREGSKAFKDLTGWNVDEMECILD